MIYALREHYESELLYLHHFVSPGMVVVDGGANRGVYTVAAARLVGPSGLILSFEPGIEAFAQLRRNIDLNGLTNVRTYHAALSDNEGKAVLYHYRQGSNSFSLGPSGKDGEGFEEVVTRTLFQVTCEHSVQRIGLIKLDVEGAEELALRGAISIIARSHPTVLFEINATAAARLGLPPQGSWDFLENLGYGFFSLTERGALRKLNHCPTMSDAINVVAIHTTVRE